VRAGSHSQIEHSSSSRLSSLADERLLEGLEVELEIEIACASRFERFDEPRFGVASDDDDELDGEAEVHAELGLDGDDDGLGDPPRGL